MPVFFLQHQMNFHFTFTPNDVFPSLNVICLEGCRDRNGENRGLLSGLLQDNIVCVKKMAYCYHHQNDTVFSENLLWNVLNTKHKIWDLAWDLLVTMTAINVMIDDSEHRDNFAWLEGSVVAPAALRRSPPSSVRRFRLECPGTAVSVRMSSCRLHGNIRNRLNVAQSTSGCPINV